VIPFSRTCGAGADGPAGGGEKGAGAVSCGARHPQGPGRAAGGPVTLAEICALGQFSRWEIRVDTGGTFTDCVARGPDGAVHRAKVLSTGALRGRITGAGRSGELRVRESWGAPPDFVKGFRFRLQDGGESPEARFVTGWDPAAGTLTLDGPPPGGIREGAGFELTSDEPAPLVAARLVTRTPAGEALPPLGLRLATTRGTNALLERSGAPLALFVTRGFGDLFEIGDQTRSDLFALDIRRPPPLASAIVEVDERIGADGSIVRPLRLDELRGRVAELRSSGITSVAVALVNAWCNPRHESELTALLRDEGFGFVVGSHEVSPFVHLLRRAGTTAVEGYLGLVIREYVEAIRSRLPGGEHRLLVMTSAGGLVQGSAARACDTLLSGPAGGVVGAALAGRRAGFDRVIAFDMGGTSTDVSRIDGEYPYRESHRVGDADLRAPALAIETVAAGGGSICSIDANGVRVGPESAGASPGPACYGAGGPLTLTDVNLLLGRLDPSRFEIPVQEAPARRRAAELLDRFESSTQTLDGLLEGFLELANERMADAIRRISVREGYDPAEYALVAFGGAGPQHACAVAERLGITRVLVPREAGVLSALGLDHAVVERFARRQILAPLAEVEAALSEHFSELEGEARAGVAAEGIAPEDIEVRQRVAHLRYRGQEATLEIPFVEGESLQSTFEAEYARVFGHRATHRSLEVESLRLVAGERANEVERSGSAVPRDTAPAATASARFAGTRQRVPVYEGAELGPGSSFEGPALVRGSHTSTVVEPGWRARIDAAGTLHLERRRAAAVGEGAGQGLQLVDDRSQAVRQELFVQRFLSLVEEMGAQLERTAISVNIRERLDFSCALLDAEGRLVANAPHIPVHLGALGLCVRRIAAALELGPGDVAVSNHPAFGGSHLPDVTVVTPVHGEGDDPVLIGYLASRAHHAEIGGTRPGSMPPDARSLVEEGVVIAPRLLVRDGVARWNEMRELLGAPPHPTRAVEENLVDLAAQIAANHRGAELLRAMARSFGAPEVMERMDGLRERAATRMRSVLRELPDGEYAALERLDDGTPLRVSIRIASDRATFDFAGTGGVHPGNLNATEAIVRSAVLYVLRLLAREELPLNEGLMEPVELVLPECLLAPRFPADPAACPAVVGGNIETSQRLVDTLLKPFELAACSQGTMNNVLFGNDRWSYYETVGGGAGAGPGFDGCSGTQVHMTNTRITDVEVLEHRFPIRVERFELRRGSGGAGRHRGGDGIVRELRFLEPLALSVLGQHRREPPYGLAGGASGAVGRQRLIRASGEVEELAPIDGREVAPEDRLLLETPGGGGFGGDGT